MSNKTATQAEINLLIDMARDRAGKDITPQQAAKHAKQIWNEVGRDRDDASAHFYYSAKEFYLN